MRLFVAIELDEAARAAIAEEQQRLAATFRDRGAAPRFVTPEHMHLTLVFIGEVPQERAPSIVAAASEAIAMPPFAVAFGGIGMFPSRGAPRVLWLGVADGAREGMRLQSVVASRLEAAGGPSGARPFHPHLTLARWKESRAADRPRADARTPAMVARVEASAVTLFQSRLSPKGSSYTVLGRAELNGVH